MSPKSIVVRVYTGGVNKAVPAAACGLVDPTKPEVAFVADPLLNDEGRSFVLRALRFARAL